MIWLARWCIGHGFKYGTNRMGLQVQYATGEAPLGEAPPGWKLSDEDLIGDFADLGITAAGAVSFMNRQYGLGMSANIWDEHI